MQGTLPTPTSAQMPSVIDDGQYIARRVSEVAARHRAEEQESHARKVRIETWKREADRKEREAKSDTAAAFLAYVKMRDFSPESKHLMLAAMSATCGADQLTDAPDWKMAIWLGGGDGEDIARIEPLPSDGREKRTLAQSWKRAWDAFNAEQKADKFDAITRQPGTKDFSTGKNKTSMMHVRFVQHLVEIERTAKSFRGVRRFERFERAAQIVVERLRRECERPGEMPAEPRKPRLKQPDTPALCRLRLADELRRVVEKHIKQALAAGAGSDDVHAMSETAFAELGKAFAAIEPETDAEEPAESSALRLEDPYSVRHLQNAFSTGNEGDTADAAKEKSDAHFEETICENIEENRKAEGVFVVNFEEYPLPENAPENAPETPPEFTLELDPDELAGRLHVRREACNLPLEPDAGDSTETARKSDASPPFDEHDALLNRYDDELKRRAQIHVAHGKTLKDARREAFAEVGSPDVWAKQHAPGAEVQHE